MASVRGLLNIQSLNELTCTRTARAAGFHHSWLPPGNTQGSWCREPSKPLGRLRSSTPHALILIVRSVDCTETCTEPNYTDLH
jgi:hypothetical protein